MGRMQWTSAGALGLTVSTLVYLNATKHFLEIIAGRTTASLPESVLVEPASYANRVTLTNAEYFINNNTVFHIAQYNPSTLFAQIYPEFKEKILDPRAIIHHEKTMLARAANSTEHDVLLSGGAGGIVRPGMRPKKILANGWTKTGREKLYLLMVSILFGRGGLTPQCYRLRINITLGL